MSEWGIVQLGDMLEFQRGFDITQDKQEPGDVPIVSSSGITSYHNQAKVKGPGVVIGRKGTLGQVCYIKMDYWPHDTTLWVIDFKGNDPIYLYHFLKLLHFENFDAGASNPTLNRNHIHKLEVKRPPLPVQRKIAAILSAYDDLIENNSRRIALLEHMAEEVYREWFVRLRFPGHEDEQLEYKSLRSYIDNYIGGGWGSDDVNGSDNCPVYVIRGTDFDEVIRGNIGTVPIRYVSFSDLKSRKVQVGDIIMENSVNHQSRTTGKCILVTKELLSMFNEDVICASFCKLIRPADISLSRYLQLNFNVLFSQGLFAYYQNVATNGIANLQIERLLDRHQVPVPPLSTLNFLNASTTHGTALIMQNLRKSRDMLLGRLLSGKVDVAALAVAGVGLSEP